MTQEFITQNPPFKTDGSIISPKISSNSLVFPLDADITTPTIVLDGGDTGISSDTADELSLVAGGVEAIRILEDTSIEVQVTKNDSWLSEKDYIGTGVVNIAKVNVDDEIEVGGTLVSGSLEFTEDSGLVTAMDMPVSADATAGDEMSYTFKIDGTNFFKFYAEADGSGGIQNESVRLDAPTICTQAPQVLSGAGAVDVTSAITHIVTTGANALTLADGEEGQEKFIVMKTDGGDGTLTPTNYANGTTLTFNDVGDSVHLLFTNGSWSWMGGRATSA